MRRQPRWCAAWTQEDLGRAVGVSASDTVASRLSSSPRLEVDKVVFRAMFVLGFELHVPDGTDVDRSRDDRWRGGESRAVLGAN